jgi:hypothetical protein
VSCLTAEESAKSFDMHEYSVKVPKRRGLLETVRLERGKPLKRATQTYGRGT